MLVKKGRTRGSLGKQRGCKACKNNEEVIFSDLNFNSRLFPWEDVFTDTSIVYATTLHFAGGCSGLAFFLSGSRAHMF